MTKCLKRFKMNFLFLFMLLLFPWDVYGPVVSNNLIDAFRCAYDLNDEVFSHEYRYTLEKIIDQGVCDVSEKTIQMMCCEALPIMYGEDFSSSHDQNFLIHELESELLCSQNRAARPSTPGVLSSSNRAQFPRDLEVGRDLFVARKVFAKEIEFADLDSHLNVANLTVDNQAKIEGNFVAQGGYFFNSGVPGVQAHVVQVTKGNVSGPNQFNSIKSAVDSITDASESNPYVVSVGPGVYIEDTIALKPFVALVGSSSTTTCITVNSSEKNCIIGSEDSYVANVFLAGATAVDKSAILFKGSSLGHLFFVKNCSFGANYNQISAISSFGNRANMFVDSCTFKNDFVRGFYIDGTDEEVFLNATNILWDVEDNNLLSAVCFATGSKTRLRVVNSCFVVESKLVGNGFVIQDGAHCTIETTRFSNLNRALYVPDVGTGPSVFLQGVAARDCTEDVRIDNPLTEAVLQGIIDWEKTVINPSASISLSSLDPDPSGGIVTIGEQHVGGTVDTVTNITPIIEDGSSLGVISGGQLSSGEGLQVAVSAGTGYISEPTLKYISWDAATLTLPENTDSFIFVNQSGNVVSSLAEPSSYTTIFIGKARTNSSDVIFIQNMKQEAEHTASQLDKSWRLALGSVYNSGSIVTKNGDLQLDVSSGRYFFSTHEYNPTGGTAIAWEAFYRDGSGNYTVENQNAVDYSHYDDNTGTLVSVPINNFARHALYVVNDGEEEKYLFVYAQQMYSTLLDAQNGVIPSRPGTWTGNITLIASIIVKNSVILSEQITEIRDERPTLGFKASAVSVTNVHGNLQGLTADDHKQYLLVNGTRAMADSLNMGGYSVTNVDLVDGVDVSSHGAVRHIPNGLDPLPTATPVSVGTTNQEGIQNSFARSDHVHSHGDLSGGTLHADATTTVSGFMSAADKVKLDNSDPSLFVRKSGDTMSGDLDVGNNDIKNVSLVDGVNVSEHVLRHNPNGADALAVAEPVSVGTTNQEGIQNSFARSDHIHSHGDLSGGTLHADATTTVSGFMSAADKVKLDNSDPSLFVRKSGDTMSGTLNVNSDSTPALNVNNGKFSVDGSSGDTSVSGNFYIPKTIGTASGIVYQGSDRFIHSRDNIVHGSSLFVGSQAGNLNSTNATQNIGIGCQALQSVTTGYQNTALGFQSLSSATSAIRSVALGHQAGNSITTGSYNTVVGNNADVKSSDDEYEIVLGCWTTGNGSNTITVGNSKNYNETYIPTNIHLPPTGQKNGAENDCTGVIYADGASLLHTRDTGNPAFSLFVGASAGNVNPEKSIANTGVGYSSLGRLKYGSNNVAVGHGAMSYAVGINGSGVDENVAIGTFALGNTDSIVKRNIAIGQEAMFLGKGNNNIGVGWHALLNNAASNNIAIGSSAGSNISTGEQNVLVGTDAGIGLTTGANNVMVGYKAGDSGNTGSDNIVIGFGASLSGSSSSNEIVIGNGAVGVASDAIVLGRPSISSCYIRGINGVNVPGGTTVYVDSNGQLGTSTSSKRFKENIETIGERDGDLMQLRPVQFNYISDETKQKQYGLIAEEVENIYPELVSYDHETGLARGVLYDNFISLLISKIQKQEYLISNLTEKEQQQDDRLKYLENTIQGILKK